MAKLTKKQKALDPRSTARSFYGVDEAIALVKERDREVRRDRRSRAQPRRRSAPRRPDGPRHGHRCPRAPART